MALKAKNIFYLALDSGEINTVGQLPSLSLAETQRRAEEAESFLVEEGHLQVCSNWSLLPWGG